MDNLWKPPKPGSRTHLEQNRVSPVSVAPNPFRKRAIAKMVSPYEMQIINIDITNKCDLACSNCTKFLENQLAFSEMTPENFRLAVRSLDGFPGIIAMVGGNPAMHRHFEELCEIFVQEVPNKNQRGLWTNNIFKHGKLAKRVFGTFNFNPHGSQHGIKSLESLRSRGWYHEGYSSHSPLLVAGKDLFAEEEMWDRIAKCEINHHWSASVIQNKGKLRAYFCEIAASFDLARGTDHGIEPVLGWWRRNISEFEDQVARFCPGCGVPARLKGHLDYQEIDTYTKSNEDIAFNSLKKKRNILIFNGSINDNTLDHKFTDYSQRLQVQAKQKFKYRVRSVLYRDIPYYLRQIHYELRRSLKNWL